jgi:hypothetical protein
MDAIDERELTWYLVLAYVGPLPSIPDIWLYPPAKSIQFNPIHISWHHPQSPVSAGAASGPEQVIRVVGRDHFICALYGVPVR